VLARVHGRRPAASGVPRKQSPLRGERLQALRLLVEGLRAAACEQGDGENESEGRARAHGVGRLPLAGTDRRDAPRPCKEPERAEHSAEQGQARDQHRRPHRESTGRLPPSLTPTARRDAQGTRGPRAGDAAQRIATLEAEIAARDAAIEEFKETGEGWKAALAERDEAIRGLVTARDEALARAEAPGPEVELHALSHDHEAKVAELETARDEALAELRAMKAELSSSQAKLPELVAARDAAVAALEQAKASLAGRDTAIAHLIAKHEAVLAEIAASAAGPWASAERHLLFFQGAEGYELVERAGPPPAAGDRVEVPGGARTVARIAASPAPGPRLPCAYLVA
jgi:hypothetical protein